MCPIVEKTSKFAKISLLTILIIFFQSSLVIRSIICPDEPIILSRARQDDTNGHESDIETTTMLICATVHASENPAVEPQNDQSEINEYPTGETEVFPENECCKKIKKNSEEVDENSFQSKDIVEEFERRSGRETPMEIAEFTNCLQDEVTSETLDDNKNNLKEYLLDQDNKDCHQSDESDVMHSDSEGGHYLYGIPK